MSTILIDIDDTICHLVPIWLQVYEEEYHHHLEKSQITEWAIHKFTIPECGLKFYDYLNMPNLNLYYAIDPIEGALEEINKLRNYGHKIIFVTSADQYNRKLTWLYEHNFILDSSSYIVSYDKSLIKGDIMIDDGIHNIEKFDGIKILFDQPWNQNVPKSIPSYYRTYGWTGIFEFIKEIV